MPLFQYDKGTQTSKSLTDGILDLITITLFEFI